MEIDNSDNSIGPKQVLRVIETKFISYETLVVALILLIYTISNPILKRFNISYLQESGICMIVGFLINLIANLITPDVF